MKKAFLIFTMFSLAGICLGCLEIIHEDLIIEEDTIIRPVIIGPIVYVSTHGNDDKGNGSEENPYRTLHKASSVTKNRGTTIYLKNGTYIESSTCNIHPGVSIVGEGSRTIIKSTLTSDSSPIITLPAENEGTDGNQSISFLKFDGHNETALAIYIFGRSNVSINNCQFINFRRNGVLFYGRTNGSFGPPAKFATGNKFYNNKMTNCAGYIEGSGGLANLNFGGQEGMLIYNNIITQNARDVGKNGCCIKGLLGEGYNKGVKIFNNILTADLKAAAPIYSFAIELWNSLGGIEIYNNEIYDNSLDIGGKNNSKGDYGFSYSIHSNIIGCKALPATAKSGIIIEGKANTSDVHIYNNTIKNVNKGIMIYPLNGAIYENIRIYYNIFDQIGRSLNGNNATCAIWLFNGEPSPNFAIRNLTILNNIFIASTTGGDFQNWAICFWNTQKSVISNYTNTFIRNNIFIGWDNAAIKDEISGAFDHLFIENNIFYLNGNSNDPYVQIIPANYSLKDNLKTDPLFVSITNYQLKSTSPAINAGQNVGLTKDHIGNPIVGNPDIGAFEYAD